MSSAHGTYFIIIITFYMLFPKSILYSKLLFLCDSTGRRKHGARTTARRVPLGAVLVAHGRGRAGRGGAARLRPLRADDHARDH